MRQPPLDPDMFSIRLAMLGPLSLGVAVGAWVTVGALGGGVGVAETGWTGVGVLVSGSLGAAGTGRPPAGSLGVTGPASSFSGWVGTAPGAIRL